MSGSALCVRDLTVEFPFESGFARVVDQVDLELAPGEVVGLVGESGSGKSVLALALMGLLNGTGARITARQMMLENQPAKGAASAGFREVRGRDIAMVFQEPATALDPVFTIGWQITSVVRRQHGGGRERAREIALAALEQAGFEDPTEIFRAYPGQLSGGMRQLVMIAMAMAVKPRVLIADEPTTALDVTTQQRVLGSLLQLRDETGAAVLLISHDLGVIASCCTRVLVMYCGRVVEQANYPDFHAQPRHPYSAGLLRAIPRIADDYGAARGIPGQAPLPGRLPAGCHFAPRCSRASSVCLDQTPLLQGSPASAFACHNPL